VSVQTTPRFDRARCAAELRKVLQGDERWYSQTGVTYIGAGRNDGSATVAAVERGWTPAEVPEEADGAGACRWLLMRHVGDVLDIATHESAEAAVRAANELADAVTT
jgi:hypothetical protein